MHRNTTSKVILPNLHVFWMEAALFIHQIMKKRVQNGV